MFSRPIKSLTNNKSINKQIQKYLIPIIIREQTNILSNGTTILNVLAENAPAWRRIKKPAETERVL